MTQKGLIHNKTKQPAKFHMPFNKGTEVKMNTLFSQLDSYQFLIIISPQEILQTVYRKKENVSCIFVVYL